MKSLLSIALHLCYGLSAQLKNDKPKSSFIAGYVPSSATGTGSVAREEITSSSVAASSPGKHFRLGSNNQVVLSSNKNINELSLTNILVISQVDGSLAGVNRDTGEIIWSTNYGPIIQSSSRRLDSPLNFTSSDAAQEFWAVEPYGEGALYFFTAQSGLNKVPFSVKDLIMASPFSIDNDDKIFTGNRKTSMVYANINNGNFTTRVPSSDSDDFNNYVAIGKTDYELTITSKNDNWSWNISYTKFGENNLHNDLKFQSLNSKSVDGSLIFPFQEKSLLSIDVNSNIPKWVTSLNATCINVFDVYMDQSESEIQQKESNKFVMISHPIKPKTDKLNDDYINSKSLDDHGTYLGLTSDNAWFALSSEIYPSLVKSSSLAKFYDLQNPQKLSPESFKQSVIGVHKNPNEQKHASTTIIYNKNKNRNNNLVSIVQPAAPTEKVNQRSLPESPDSSNGELLSIDPPTEPQSKKKSSVFKLFMRLFENSIFTAVLLSIVYYLSKAGFIPPITIILYKSGFMKRGQSVIFEKSFDEEFNGVLKGKADLIDNETKQKGGLALSISEEKKSENVDFDDSDDENVDEKDNLKSEEVARSTDVDVDSKKEVKDSINEVRNMKEKLIEEINEKINKRDVVSKTVTNSRDEDEEDEDFDEKLASTPNDNEIGQTSTPIKNKKRKRGSRGGKNKKKGSKIESVATLSNINEEIINGNDVELIVKQNNRNDLGKSRLIISDDILGYGSHGTVVYKGTFENRPVAVKRMLIDFYDVASHEVSLLQESDDHPNVIRYFCSRQSDRFLYIALELCSANLEDLVDGSTFETEIELDKDELLIKNHQDVLYQMTSGLNHLHKLNIVHRDIKPQNILVTPTKLNDLRVLISDFGLCKKLEPDQSSFRGTTASGTSGWRAPELLSENNNSRISKMVDVFSLGLVFYYVLSNGDHPFGDKYNRESNILRNNYSLNKIKFGSNSVSEAKDLISKMLEFNPKKRITTEVILKHPFFWSNEKKIEFLLKVSDKLNILSRDSTTVIRFEKNGLDVFNGKPEWKSQFDVKFFDNINTFRKYDSTKLMDLLRVIRNKYHHINEIPEEFGINEDNFLDYFIQTFPNLLVYCYYFVEKNMKNDFETFY